MSDIESTGEVAEMVGVSVVNTAHEGYRRAGFVLHQGENTLPPVTAAVLKALEADPRLAVMVIATDIDSVTSGRLGDQVVSTTIMLDEAPLLAAEIESLGNALEPAKEITTPVKAPTAAPDTETAQPETPKKGKGKK